MQPTDTQPTLTPQALDVLRERYLAKDPETGAIIETPEDLFRRVARCIAESERLYGVGEPGIAAVTEEFYRMMAENRFMPNTPTLSNAGRPGAMQQYSACFVIPVPDDMRGIGEAITAALLIHKSGGGTGYSFSCLRPKGDRVRSSGGVASGPVSFMKIIDQATEQVRQGGTRRGANMGILSCDHPDILEFVRCKSEDGQIRNFNISVAVTDDFMRAVENDTDWPLVNPHSGQVVKRIQARALWNVLVEHAWKNGEPGLFFIDHANAHNPLPRLGRIEATNPCITADALVYTANGLQRVGDLVASGQPVDAVVEGLDCCSPATPMFKTASQQPVFRLETVEGYTLRLTRDHKIKTQRGMVPAEELIPGDTIRLLSQGGAFGADGSRDMGLVLGWIVGDGFLTSTDACLDFHGDKAELAPMFAEAVQRLVPDGDGRRKHDPVSAISVPTLATHQVSSTRLRKVVEEHGLTEQNKLTVPKAVLAGSAEMQQGFLQALFTADGTVIGAPNKGVSVRLCSISLPLLQDVQRLLLNWGIASAIYQNRRLDDMRLLPDGHGGRTLYQTRPYHDLVISKSNVERFAERLGFLLPKKQQRLVDLLGKYDGGPYRETFWVRFKALVPDGVEDVYCLTEPITHTFVANGMVIANCGEKPLHPWDACTLGHVNLERHLVRHPETGRMDLDWSRLKDTVQLGVRFLDNVVDANRHPLPEINERTRQTRQIGLGVMGLARVLIAKEIPYDSEAALTEVDRIMGRIKQWAWECSTALAMVRGVYPAWTGSLHETTSSKVRNSFVLTIAPTGTTSMIAHTSSGIEPEYSLIWFKRVMDGKKIPYVCEPFERVARAEGWWSNDLLEQIQANHGSCRGLAAVPEKWQRIFATAHDIAPEWHVRMQATVQQHVDSAVSKTINMAYTATVEDVSKAYTLAWKLGCKGITVYRDGSRKDQVLNVGQAKSADPAKANGNGHGHPTGSPGSVTASSSSAPPVQTKDALPAVLDAKRIRVESPDGPIYVHISYLDGNPVEIFTTTSEEAKHEEIYEAFSRIFSTALKHGVPLEKLLKQLDGANKKFGSVSTIPAAILRAFRMTQTESSAKTACPKCAGVLVFQEGCLKCVSCTWSKCE
ncbi:MAG: ribonucleotide reductase N-terminal alpha domain-containing protein [Nitrospirota bacterium]